MDGDDDSNAPEELTMDQGIRQEEEIRKVLSENKTRVARESKERRRKWAHSKAKVRSGGEVGLDDTSIEPHQEAHDIKGMLPDSIVNLLAASEKIIFPEFEEEVINEDEPNLKKKSKNDGQDTSLTCLELEFVSPMPTMWFNCYRHEAVLLKDLPPAECLKRSMEFLKKRKMQVSTSGEDYSPFLEAWWRDGSFFRGIVYLDFQETSLSHDSKFLVKLCLKRRLFITSFDHFLESAYLEKGETVSEKADLMIIRRLL